VSSYQNQEILDVNQLAEFLGVTANTIHGLTRQRARHRGEPVIPHLKIGRELKFRRDSVLNWLAAKEEAAVRQ
jgi:hypothetical protein